MPNNRLIEFKMSVKGQVEFHRGLTGIRDTCDDITPTWNMIADSFREYMKERFNAQGEFQGLSKWRDLTPAYEAWKLKHYGPLPILTLTRYMMTSFSRANATDHVEEIEPKKMTIGSSDKKAVWHHEGRGHNKIRQILLISEQEKKKWVRIIHLTLHDQINYKAAQKYSP